MRKFLILSNTLSERADSVNAFELISIFREHFGNECVVAFSDEWEPNPSRLEHLKSLDVPFIFYRTRQELEEFSRHHQTTHTIAYSGGQRNALAYSSSDGRFRVGDNFHITQTVFKSDDIHGDMYLYISRWLMDASLWKVKLGFGVRSDTVVDYLPLSIPDNPPKEALPLDLQAKISGRPFISRVGAKGQFNDSAAKSGVLRFLNSHPDFVFVAVNTAEFSDHPQIVYYPYLDRPQIWELYANSSAALNGRVMGESFGYSIYEPLAMGVPVAAPHPIRNPLMDKNHYVVLRDSELLFSNSRTALGALEKAVSGKWKNQEEVFLQVSEARRSNVAAKLLDLLVKNGA